MNQFVSIWGGKAEDYAYGVALDSSGNVYMSGSTYSFGTSLSTGLPQAFLLKFDHAGNLLWQKGWQVGYWVLGEGVAVDPTGNIFVVGYYENRSGSGVRELSSPALLKYDSSGSLIWKTSLGSVTGQIYACANRVATDASGDVYVIGGTRSYAASDALLLLKYNSTGSLLWQTAWRLGGGAEGLGLAVDSSSNSIYVTGSYPSLPSLSINRTAIIMKFNSDGSVVWQKTWGGRQITYGVRAETDATGNLYVLGNIPDFVHGGSFWKALFLLKLDPLGNLQWQKAWGNGVDIGGVGLAIDSKGNAIMTGNGFLYAPHCGYRNVLLFEVNASGQLMGDMAAGSCHSTTGHGNVGNDVVVDGSDYAYVTGSVTAAPPYVLSFNNFIHAELDTTGYSLQTTYFLAIPSNFTEASPNVTIFTPNGNTSFSGTENALLARYDLTFAGPCGTSWLSNREFLLLAGIAIAATIAGVTAVLTISVKRRRRARREATSVT